MANNGNASAESVIMANASINGMALAQ